MISYTAQISSSKPLATGASNNSTAQFQTVGAISVSRTHISLDRLGVPLNFTDDKYEVL